MSPAIAHIVGVAEFPHAPRHKRSKRHPLCVGRVAFGVHWVRHTIAPTTSLELPKMAILPAHRRPAASWSVATWPPTRSTASGNASRLRAWACSTVRLIALTSTRSSRPSPRSRPRSDAPHHAPSMPSSTPSGTSSPASLPPNAQTIFATQATANLIENDSSRRTLTCQPTSIDRQDMPLDIGRCIRRQEDRRAAEISRIAPPPRRDAIEDRGVTRRIGL